jgi:hypothetical protein
MAPLTAAASSLLPVVALLSLVATSSLAQLPPNIQQTWQLNLSTIMMPCNQSGILDHTVNPFAIVDIDWSNNKSSWAQTHPMSCEEDLVTQTELLKASSPQRTVWVYRNSIKALAWYSTVREKLEDPDYSPWFMPFNASILNGTAQAHVPVCDTAFSPPKCSDLYHDQSQSPSPIPGGDGLCPPSGCDSGSVPSGEYLFDFRSWNVSVRGQTLGEWYLEEYFFGPTGLGNPSIAGLYVDDTFDVGTGPSEMEAHVLEDLGLDAAETGRISAIYYATMKQVYDEVLRRGKFTWLQLWVGQEPEDEWATCCPAPLVQQATCAADLRSLCSASSPAQTRALMYSFSPGVCGGDPSNLTMFDQDLANFLLVRGPYAYLGHGWLGCGPTLEFAFPDALNADVGEPTELCHETVPGSSGVFVRDWTKASVSMDCTTWTGTVEMKGG